MSVASPLAELLAGFAVAPPEVQVSDVTLDSRAVTPGALFLACRGRAHHGLEFAPEAAARGARSVLYEPEGAPPAPALPPATFILTVPELTARAGLIADRFFGAPSQHLTVAGITGTNGKTTCAWLLAQALARCGRPAGYIGTLGAGMPPQVVPLRHTTPDAVTLHRQLAQLLAAGAACVSLEVSSHALDQSRVNGVRFHTAAFTNLTRDHLDYHGSMEAYGAAKARLFAWPGLAFRIINVDDPFGAQLARAPGPGRLIVTTRAATPTPPAAQFVRATRVRIEPTGLSVEVESSFGGVELPLRLMGEFNVDNALTVLAVLLAFGIPLRSAAQALARVRPASGPSMTPSPPGASRRAGPVEASLKKARGADHTKISGPRARPQSIQQCTTSSLPIWDQRTPSGFRRGLRRMSWLSAGSDDLRSSNDLRSLDPALIIQCPIAAAQHETFEIPR